MLINCKECGKELSDKASFCPNCGCPTDFSNGINKESVYQNIAMQKLMKKEEPKPKKSYWYIVGFIFDVIGLLQVHFYTGFLAIVGIAIGFLGLKKTNQKPYKICMISGIIVTVIVVLNVITENMYVN